VEGHLYTRGKSKVWYLRYDVPSADGKRNQRNVRIGKMTKSEAEAKKRDLLRKIDDGIWTEDAKGVTVETYFESWLDTQRNYLAANTHERYESLLRLHVTPLIGSLRLTKVQPEHIRGVYQTAHDKGLSGRSCLHIHRVLHTAFNHAVRVDRVVKENPLQRVKAPRPSEYEVATMSPDKVRLLVQIAKGTRLEVPVALAAVTGLRRGELLALRWTNVDLERGSLFVAEALEQTRTSGVRFKAPKSKSSRRFIPLAPEAVEMLRAHRDAQDEAKQRAPFYADNDLVFCNPDGQPWPPDTFTVQFAELAKNVGMKGFRFHDLRHAFASLTLADGRPIKEVQLLMGHSTANTTLSVYARAVEGLGRAAVNGLARSILSTQG